MLIARLSVEQAADRCLCRIGAGGELDGGIPGDFVVVFAEFQSLPDEVVDARLRLLDVVERRQQLHVLAGVELDDGGVRPVAIRELVLIDRRKMQAGQIRDLARGQFLGLGPAISRRPVAVRIGAVRTGTRALAHALAPPPTASPDELHALLHADPQGDARRAEQQARAAAPVAVAAEELIERIAAPPIDAALSEPGARVDVAPVDPGHREAAIGAILTDMAAEERATFQPTATLFQDFSVRCRMQRIDPRGIDVVQFRRRFAMALAGMSDSDEGSWTAVLRIADRLSEDLLAPFLVMARAAQENAPCPDDDELARIYGTNSPGRVRRLLEHYEKSGLIVVRTDFSGRRSITIPELGLATAPL